VNTMVDFVVVDIQSAYNMILRMLYLLKIRGVSIYHNDRTKIGMILALISFSFCLILGHYPVI
jgi:hypothetical protein